MRESNSSLKHTVLKGVNQYFVISSHKDTACSHRYGCPEPHIQLGRSCLSWTTDVQSGLSEGYNRHTTSIQLMSLSSVCSVEVTVSSLHSNLKTTNLHKLILYNFNCTCNMWLIKILTQPMQHVTLHVKGSKPSQAQLLPCKHKTQSVFIKQINISVPFAWSEAVAVHAMKAYKGSRGLSPLILLILALDWGK